VCWKIFEVFTVVSCQPATTFSGPLGKPGRVFPETQRHTSSGFVSAREKLSNIFIEHGEIQIALR